MPAFILTFKDTDDLWHILSLSKLCRYYASRQCLLLSGLSKTQPFLKYFLLKGIGRYDTSRQCLLFIRAIKYTAHGYLLSPWDHKIFLAVGGGMDFFYLLTDCPHKTMRIFSWWLGGWMDDSKLSPWDHEILLVLGDGCMIMSFHHETTRLFLWWVGGLIFFVYSLITWPKT